MENTEKPVEEKQLAHPGKRYQGQFIDSIVCILLFAAGVYFAGLLNYEPNNGFVVFFSLPFFYFVLSDALPNGQSIGKKLLGLSVVTKSTGKPCSLVQSIVRNVFTPILGIIDAILIFGKKRQRLGDLMANTVVIKLV